MFSVFLYSYASLVTHIIFHQCKNYDCKHTLSLLAHRVFAPLLWHVRCHVQYFVREENNILHILCVKYVLLILNTFYWQHKYNNMMV